MSPRSLADRTGGGAPAGRWSVTAPVAADVARAALGDAHRAPLEAVPDPSLGKLLATLTAVEAQAASLRGRVLAEAERRRVAEQQAATGTDAWAAALTGERRELLAVGLRIAELLGSTFATTREAYAAGRLTTRQVRVIVGAAEQAPPDATPEQVATAEELLVARATGEATRSGRPMDPRRLRQAARRMFDVVDRDLADRHEAVLLGREAGRARRETWMTLSDNGDGTWSGRFCLPELHGQMLNRALDRLTTPRRWGRLRDRDPGAAGGTGQGRRTVDESAPEQDGYRLGAADRRGLALGELIEHLPTEGHHAANGVTLLVTMRLADLLADLSPGSAGSAAGGAAGGVATLDDGVRVTADQARRLACEAGLVPVVLGGASLPLDLGREERLHSAAQRRALALGHDSCAIGGCERPFAWCEIHHILPWSRGGRTDLGNALPLCAWHHHRTHETTWRLEHDRRDGWRLRPRR